MLDTIFLFSGRIELSATNLQKNEKIIWGISVFNGISCEKWLEHNSKLNRGFDPMHNLNWMARAMHFSCSIFILYIYENNYLVLVDIHFSSVLNGLRTFNAKTKNWLTVYGFYTKSWDFLITFDWNVMLSFKQLRFFLLKICCNKVNKLGWRIISCLH